MTTNPDGQIWRADENTVIVEVEGETWAKDAPGVECMNPEELKPRECTGRRSG